MKAYQIETGFGVRINIALYAFGIAKVTDWAGSAWNEDLRKFMFPSCRDQYPFLTAHLFGNWWFIGFGARKYLPVKPPELKPDSEFVSVLAYHYFHIEAMARQRGTRDRLVAETAFQSIIDGLSGVEAIQMDRLAMIDFLKERKDAFAQSIAADLRE